RLQHPCVEGTGYAMASVRSTVQKRPMVHGRDGAVLLEAGLRAHEDGMPAALAIEDLLAREADLDGAPRHHRQLRDDDFMRERIALSSEAAAVGRGDDADPVLRQLQHLGE